MFLCGLFVEFAHFEQSLVLRLGVGVRFREQLRGSFEARDYDLLLRLLEQLCDTLDALPETNQTGKEPEEKPCFR